MPVTSSSVPPRGRTTSSSSSDSGSTTHSRPRARTSDPTAKLICLSCRRVLTGLVLLAENAGVLRDDLRPVVFVIEANHGVAVVEHVLFLHAVPRLALRE